MAGREGDKRAATPPNGGEHGWRASTALEVPQGRVQRWRESGKDRAPVEPRQRFLHGISASSSESEHPVEAMDGTLCVLQHVGREVRTERDYFTTLKRRSVKRPDCTTSIGSSSTESPPGSRTSARRRQAGSARDE